MQLGKIRLEGFRNYQKAEITFADGINVISGENAQGKTNLLEAVYFLTCGKSFRAKTDQEVIGFESEFAEIEAEVIQTDRTDTLFMRIPRGGKKSFSCNGVKLKSAAELRGRLTAVLFCPDDLKIVREGAAVHRRLMDTVLFQLRPRYASLISEFSRLYDRKTRILRDWREKPSLLELLEDYNLRLAQLGTEILRFRAAFTEELSKRAAVIHTEFSGGAERLSIAYKTVKTVKDPRNAPPQEIFEQLMEHQKSHYRAEIESGLCLSGVSKDDLEIELNGRPAKNFASQGQTRTAALSIKLAEREIHFAASGEYPVLLLDDVLSELDSKRQSFVLNHIDEGQVLITCCEDDGIRDRTNGKVFCVEKGSVRS
ncbi:MAG: DNA replication/repair protein RecF [Oscillospiraceae bacterium]|nr:DNA replication/repair protein RecF [Oscillospiraceae bacterium]